MDIREQPRIIDSVWLYRFLTFIGVPAIMLSLGFWGKRAFWYWLILLAAYIVLLSVLGITNQPARGKPERTIKPIVGMLGSITWGGFLGLLYAFLYLVVFHSGELFAQ